MDLECSSTADTSTSSYRPLCPPCLCPPLQTGMLLDLKAWISETGAEQVPLLNELTAFNQQLSGTVRRCGWLRARHVAGVCLLMLERPVGLHPAAVRDRRRCGCPAGFVFPAGLAAVGLNGAQPTGVGFFVLPQCPLLHSCRLFAAQWLGCSGPQPHRAAGPARLREHAALHASAGAGRVRLWHDWWAAFCLKPHGGWAALRQTPLAMQALAPAECLGG